MLISNARIVSEDQDFLGHVLIKDQKIEKIFTAQNAGALGELFKQNIETLDVGQKLLIPGVIDDQVHFREPGLTHKGSIYSESRAAAAGGITSFMEMPNTKPQTTNFQALEDKFDQASKDSLVNYSFYFGATNENADLIADVDVKNTCGIKVFMGSSTGNMLVDKEQVLEAIFKSAKTIVATHCEEEALVRANLKKHIDLYGDEIPYHLHPVIRDHQACLASSTKAVDLAKKYDARLHVLHISTAQELELFEKQKDVTQKRITAEACVHHLFFNDNDYKLKNQFIKWNPAVKTEADRKAIFSALFDGTIDVIATDHAPHTLEEKNNPYTSCPSGGPLVQHSLQVMLDFYEKGDISLERVVELMCHNPARLFEVEKRGFIKEGYFADLVLVDLEKPETVKKSNLLYHCGWSPFEHYTFLNSIHKTYVNGKVVYDQGKIIEQNCAQSLTFNR